ncbi:MAG: hypothetical protein JW908_09245 [Anaerolineales bacterium]|nr:hypothetical protein [Anaerolineales bacterium]
MGGTILADILDELIGIVKSIPEALWKDALFNQRSRSMQDKFNLWIKSKDSLNISLTDQLQYKTGINQKLFQENIEIRNLLTQKDKEISRLNQKIKSSEYNLHNRHKAFR